MKNVEMLLWKVLNQIKLKIIGLIFLKRIKNKVTEDTPPSNVELLVKSPNGIIHLSRWRESYNIFGCQAKSESIVDWKWKKI
jgi:hypothetical protein